MFKEALFSICPDRTIEPVETAAGTTYVRTITVREKDELDATARDGRLSRSQMLIAFCCKENGSPEFDVFDVGRIEALPMGLIEPILDAASRLNQLRAEDVEGIRKNSENGQVSRTGTS